MRLLECSKSNDLKTAPVNDVIHKGGIRLLRLMPAPQILYRFKIKERGLAGNPKDVCRASKLPASNKPGKNINLIANDISKSLFFCGLPENIILYAFRDTKHDFVDAANRLQTADDVVEYSNPLLHIQILEWLAIKS